MSRLGQIIKRLEARYNNLGICYICKALGEQKSGLYSFRCKEHKTLFFCHQCGKLLSLPYQRICVSCWKHNER